MVSIEPKTIKMITTNEEEIIEKLVREDHVFRKLQKILNFEAIISPYRKLYSNTGAEGIDVIKGFKCLLVQFWEDYSDRQMEKVLEENVAVKWFCGFTLLEETPDHSYFGKLRQRFGTHNIANIFNTVNEILRSKGLFGDFFKFIDASSIITKTALWKERDRAIANGEEKLNNSNIHNYSADKEANWGAKNKNNFWFGYKRNNLVDMRFGLIEKICVTPANVLDYRAFVNICPENCMTFMDKLYDCKLVKNILKANNCHDGTIKKKNNKEKNFDLDRWISKIRMPFESTFSKQRKRAKYRGLKKVLFQNFIEAISYNLKKAIRILEPLGA